LKQTPQLNTAPWKINLLVFVGLFLLVLGYFYWQINQSRQAFAEHVQEHTQLVTAVVTFNLNNANQSLQIIEQVITSFLSNTARFVAYLDEVEPFTADELAAYAHENGLVGLWIQRGSKPPVMTPANWWANEGGKYLAPTLLHRQQLQQYVLFWPDPEQQLTIMLALPAEKIERLQQQMQIPQLLETLNQLSGVEQLRIETTQQAQKHQLAANERQITLGENTVTLVIESDILAHREALLWQQFWLFSLFLALVAVLFSWVLQRYQNLHTQKLLQLQQQLAHQREDALLGRAAAAISHEIRNPLNAISMGLQRLQLEKTNLNKGHQSLIEAMLNAVTRSNGIITGLQRFAQHLKPELQLVDVSKQIHSVLALYTIVAQEQKVIIATTMEQLNWEVDPELFGLIMENLIKNALEAQPWGGYINIVLQRYPDYLLLQIENGSSADIDLEQCLAPYYTTKTRGTGLGLAMVKKIVLAHGGGLNLEQPDDNCFLVQISLPVKVNT